MLSPDVTFDGEDRAVPLERARGWRQAGAGWRTCSGRPPRLSLRGDFPTLIRVSIRRILIQVGAGRCGSSRDVQQLSTVDTGQRIDARPDLGDLPLLVAAAIGRVLDHLGTVDCRCT